MGPFRESPIHLLVIVLLPALAGLASLVRPRGARPLALVPLAAATSAAMLAYCFVVAGPKALLLSHVARLMRVGALDAVFGFAAAPASALLCGAIAVATILLGVARDPRTTQLRAARLGVASSAAMTSALAQGFPTLLAGLSVLALAAALGASDTRRAIRGLTVALTACVVIAVAASASFWTLGGKFLDGRDYFSDYQPRFAVDIEGGSGQADAKGGTATTLRVGDKAKLYMSSHPGARIYLGVANEGQLRGRVEAIAESPAFGVEIPAALHKIAIDPGGGATIGGDGAEVALLDAVRAQPGSNVVLRLVGPSLSFDEIAKQVGPRLELKDRMLGGSHLLGVVFALLGVAALAFATAFASDDDPDMSAMGTLGGLTLLPVAAIFGGAATSGALLGAFAPLFVVVLGGLAVWRRGNFATTSTTFAVLAAAGVAGAASGSHLAPAALAIGSAFTAIALRAPALAGLRASVAIGAPMPLGPAAGLAAGAAGASIVSPIAGILVGVAWAVAAYVAARFRTFDTTATPSQVRVDPWLRGAAALLGPLFVAGVIVLAPGAEASLLPIVCALGGFAVAGAAQQLGAKRAPLAMLADDEAAPASPSWFDRIDGLFTAPFDRMASRPRDAKRHAP